MLIWRERPAYVGNDSRPPGTSATASRCGAAFRLVRESPYLRAIAR